MNIVFAISGMGFGGAERVVSVLSNELVKEHNVSIVLTSGGDNCAYKLDSRVNLISVTQDKSNIKTWRNFRKTCRGLHPDVVIAFTSLLRFTESSGKSIFKSSFVSQMTPTMRSTVSIK